MEENTNVPVLPPPSVGGSSPQGEPGGKVADDQKSNRMGIVLGIAGVIIVILIIVGAVLLIGADNATTGRVRDVFIIFMALESFVIGAALVILIIQLAALINLLQNEIKPIIQTTNETVNTLRGTVMFISEYMTEPVIKLNAALAGLKQFVDILRPGKRS